MQSRGSPISESLSDANVGETIGEMGAKGIENRGLKAEKEIEAKGKEVKDVVPPSTVKTSGVHVASVGKDGKVIIEDVKA